MDYLYQFWANLQESLTMQVFVSSAVVLLLGLILMGWYYAVKLSHLDPVSISDIEEDHPHLPSARVISTIFITSICLLIAAYMGLLSVPPFDKPYQFIYLAAILVLGGASGILCELHLKNGRDFPFAFTIGTALSFIFLAFTFSIPQGSLLEAITIMLVLIACIILARRVFFPTWSNRVQITTFIVIIFWLLLYGPQILTAFQLQ